MHRMQHRWNKREREKDSMYMKYFNVTIFRSMPAELVVWPRTKEQVSKLASICYQEEVAIVPFGAASGLEGGVNAINVSSAH